MRWKCSARVTLATITSKLKKTQKQLKINTHNYRRKKKHQLKTQNKRTRTIPIPGTVVHPLVIHTACNTQFSAFSCSLGVIFFCPSCFCFLPYPPQILPIDLGLPSEEAPLANDAGVFATGGMAEALGHSVGDRPEVGNPFRL